MFNLTWDKFTVCRHQVDYNVNGIILLFYIVITETEDDIIFTTSLFPLQELDQALFFAKGPGTIMMEPAVLNIADCSYYTTLYIDGIFKNLLHMQATVAMLIHQQTNFPNFPGILTLL